MVVTDNGAPLPSIAKVVDTRYNSGNIELKFPESPTATTINLKLDFEIGSTANGDHEVVDSVSGAINVIIC